MLGLRPHQPVTEPPELGGSRAGGQEEEPEEAEEGLDSEEPLDDVVDDGDGAGDFDDCEDDAEEESPEDAEDFGVAESWVLDLASEGLASEVAVLAAGFSASIAFFLDSEG